VAELQPQLRVAPSTGSWSRLALDPFGRWLASADGDGSISRSSDNSTDATRLMFWQPRSCSASIIAASRQVATGSPCTGQEVPKFWQNTQHRPQPEVSRIVNHPRASRIPIESGHQVITESR